MDPELFFTDHGPNAIYGDGPKSATRRAWEKAKQICVNCPVMRECARDALGEVEGVWGGLDPGQRLQLRREHGVKIRGLKGPLKREYAELAHKLRNDTKLTVQDAARIIGVSLSTLAYLVDWYEDDVAKRTARADKARARRANESGLGVESIPRTPRTGASVAYDTKAKRGRQLDRAG